MTEQGQQAARGRGQSRRRCANGSRRQQGPQGGRRPCHADRGLQVPTRGRGSRRRWRRASACSARTTSRRPQGRWPRLRQGWPGVELHLIGGLQTNKAAAAVALFDVIQTVDRPKLAREMAKEMARQGRAPRLLVQVNIGEEPQKSGVAPAELDAFVALCRGDLGLAPTGLMAIPPEDEDVALHAALLAKLAARNGLPQVSVGMSGDYESGDPFRRHPRKSGHRDLRRTGAAASMRSLANAPHCGLCVAPRRPRGTGPLAAPFVCRKCPREAGCSGLC